MQPAADASVGDWLAWLETLHPADIELGLERVRVVAERLDLLAPRAEVITVAGTNGKGSVCAFAEALLLADGQRPGLYTSPHLTQYNERVRVQGREIDDAALVASFAEVAAARGDVPLTFFEFATLAALAHFRAEGATPIILETGLGGRLDATNIVASDVAVIASIGLDHQEWLGPDRDAIAAEKAGIARADRPLIMAEPDPPPAWPGIAAATGAREVRVGRDYRVERTRDDSVWRWHYGRHALAQLAPPRLLGGYQIDNAAAALTALTCLRGEPPARACVDAALVRAHVPGRFEVVAAPVEVIFDVGHNPQAAERLAQGLERRPSAGRTRAVIGMYRDKAVEAVGHALAGVVDEWYCADLPGPRGLPAAELAQRLGEAVGGAREPGCHASAADALAAAHRCSQAGDRIVVTGSFATVAGARAVFL